MVHGSDSIIDYYEVLGLEIDASDEEIKKAYRSLAKAFHPDTSTHPKAKERFLAISAAYDVLSDPDAKRDYDSRLRASYGEDSDGDEDSDDSDEDEFSRMADYEFYSDEPERFLINGVERRFESARHIIVGDDEYIIVDGEMINIGGISRFNYEGEERYRIDGVEYKLMNAEHYYQSGNEYVVIEGKPYLIKSI
jgi:curved DNA-binding protein CbpA